MDGPVVAGTDGSTTATMAVVEAIELAKRFGQPLHIVCAYHQQALHSEGVPSEFDLHLSSEDAALSILENVASRARVAGVKVETHAIKGDAADAILGLAATLDAGVIVVPTWPPAPRLKRMRIETGRPSARMRSAELPRSVDGMIGGRSC